MTLPADCELRADLTCILCDRTSATVQGREGQRAPIQPIQPEHAQAVQQMRCPYCAGRLWVGHALVIRVLHSPPRDVARSKRSRPPKRVPDPTPRLCTDCMKRRAKWDRPRCETCAALRNASRLGVYGRVMDALKMGGLLRPKDVAAIAGVTTSAVRRHVYRARSRGVPIVTVGKAYRLTGGTA